VLGIRELIYRSVSEVIKLIVSLVWSPPVADCVNVTVAGSCRLFVVNFIQASMEAASSSARFIATLSGGGSIELQVCNRRTNNIKQTILTDITTSHNTSD
jgi:hypothetical protein